MSYLSKLKAIPRNLPTGIQPSAGAILGVSKGFLYDKGERAVMAAALGAAKGYYYDRLVFKGIGVEAIVAVGGYIGAALVGGKMARHMERAGDVGLTAYMYSIGASWGADKAGRGVATTASLPGGKRQVVGVIPPRAGGAFLTADELANYAGPR